MCVGAWSWCCRHPLAVYNVAPATADSTEHTARNLRRSGCNNNAILRGTEGGEKGSEEQERQEQEKLILKVREHCNCGRREHGNEENMESFIARRQTENSSAELLEDEEMRPRLATQESLADMIEAAEDSEVETPDWQETTVDSVNTVDTVDTVDGVTDCPVSSPARSLSSPLAGNLASPGEETARPAGSSMTPAQSPSSPVAILRNKIRHLSGSGDSRRASR